MFTNLKNKLIEEVKASPSKFQQFAAAVSSSASTTPNGSESTTTTNENFFSITEEDTPQNSPYKPLKLPHTTARGSTTTSQLLNNGPAGMGAIPRVRKLSSSSMASDVSFRLPTYESPAVYHLQSDLESNCSELEDTASTAKLDVITKEQLYDAYKKSLERYHKYRCRYTDLAKKYKDLERDSSKARSVLVETQEKAIRRISELREQCSLEQQAKAHLEEALRIEMDDMQCKVQAYQTKLKLLGENPESVTSSSSKILHNVSDDSLIDFEDRSRTNNKRPGEKENSSTNENEVSSKRDKFTSVSQLEVKLQEREQYILELTEKLQNFEATIIQLRKQEEENALLLAQTKQAIHSELENKESEVNKLTDTIKKMQNDLKLATKKESKLNGQLDELNELKEKFKNLQVAKQETDAKLIATEHMLHQLKEQYTSKESLLAAAEDKLALLMKDNELKFQDLRQQNAQLEEMVQRYQQNEVSLAEIDNELNSTKNENDNLRGTISLNELSLRDLKKESAIKNEQLENMRQECILLEEKLNKALAKTEELYIELQKEKSTKEGYEQKIVQLESELKISNEQNEHNESETIAALKSEIHKMNIESSGQLNAVKQQLASKDKELRSNANKLSKQKKQHDNQQNKIREQNEVIEKLKVELNKHEQHLERLQIEANEREQQSEEEKDALKHQVTNILLDISQMENQMRSVWQSHNELEEEKQRLEQKIESMHKQAQDANDGTQHWREQLIKTEDKLRRVETKLLEIEGENSMLAENNALLEKERKALEQVLAEKELYQKVFATNESETRMKMEAAEEKIMKLNEKMSQVLDENSRMQNAQELMDHDYRTMQDKLDALEKEKLLSEDAFSRLQSEADQLKERKSTAECRLRETVEQLQQMEEKFAEEKKRCESTSQELNEMLLVRERLQLEEQNLNDQLVKMKAAHFNDKKWKDSLQEKVNRITELENEIEREKSVKGETKLKEENVSLKAQIEALTKTVVDLETTKNQYELLQQQFNKLNEQLNETSNELDFKSKACIDLELHLKELKNIRQEQEPLTQELQAANEEVVKLKTDLDKYKEAFAEKQAAEAIIQTQLEQAQEKLNKLETVESDVHNLKNIEHALREEIMLTSEMYKAQVADLTEKLQTANEDIDKLHESNDAIQVEMDQVKNKNELQIQSFEISLKQLQNDNENLNSQLMVSKVNAETLLNYEQLQLENEYLNKHVKQLEEDVALKEKEANSQLTDEQEMREKLKSIQCELYVLKENSQKHEKLLEKKQKENDDTILERDAIKKALTNEQAETERQAEHIKYITEQNDAIQNELLHRQYQVTELEQKLRDTTTELNELKSEAMENEAKLKEVEILHKNSEEMRNTFDKLSDKIKKLTTELEEKTKLQEALDALREDLPEQRNQTEIVQVSAELNKAHVVDSENLRQINEALQRELEDLKRKSTAKIMELQQEIDDMHNTEKHIGDRLKEVEDPQDVLQVQRILLDTANGDSEILNKDTEQLQHEKAELEAKLQAIMNEVRDVSNRNMFLEQQCENALILEQSNERLKLQNAKLSRQLDETLVSMQHNEGITANTEFEYLKNIMFQYLTGSANGNNETLVKVISAVLKFSPQQTQVAIEKEHQRRSLFNKIL